MASHPEFVVMATGGLALTAGYAREGGFPKNGTTAVVATLALVVITSAASDTPIGPLVTALAWLALLGVSYAVIPALTKAQQTKKKG